ncbi:MAG: GNAT family N-acetyltransferase [Sphingopyxis sp.]
MGLSIILKPCAGEAELFDPAITGPFAEPMAEMASAEQVAPWCGYVARRGGVAVGFGGFKGAPDGDGWVEIGYLTFPGNEGMGVATRAAALLVDIAMCAGVGKVCAHTLPAENASTTVLRRNGFVRAGEATDPDEGVVWRWEKIS